MSDFPTIIDYDLPVISSVGVSSVGGQWIGMVGSGTSPTQTWPVANLALYMPFYVGVETTIVKMFWVNGTTAGTNNIDVGIYTQAGVRIVSGGGTLQSGGNAAQEVDITDITLTPGLYYMAMACDGTTAQFEMSINIAGQQEAIGMYEQTSAYPLPATATFAVSSRILLPWLALTRNTLV